jgi:hypothetical protein
MTSPGPGLGFFLGAFSASIICFRFLFRAASASASDEEAEGARFVEEVDDDAAGVEALAVERVVTVSGMAGTERAFLFGLFVSIRVRRERMIGGGSGKVSRSIISMGLLAWGFDGTTDAGWFRSRDGAAVSFPLEDDKNLVGIMCLALEYGAFLRSRIARPSRSDWC